jgi:hypothetical protein
LIDLQATWEIILIELWGIWEIISINLWKIAWVFVRYTGNSFGISVDVSEIALIDFGVYGLWGIISTNL